MKGIMNMKNINDKYLDKISPEMSIEEFDALGNLEDHVFSERYTQRKNKELTMFRKNKNKSIRVQVLKVAAAVILVLSTPVAVNAATNGELFQRLWGNSGKKTVESHEETVVSDDKIDENGNPTEYTVTYPKIEYVEADEEKAEELIGDKITTEPVATVVGDTTITVNSVVRDGYSIVAEYTIEKEGGVDCLNYSQLDNEAKGAWRNDESTIDFSFTEGSGKIYVDLEKSTPDKLYCYEYMVDNTKTWGGEIEPLAPITDHITLNTTEYTQPISTFIDDPDADITDYIKEEQSVDIPVKDKVETTRFQNAEGGSIDISPISMCVDPKVGLGKAPDGEEMTLDYIYRYEICYKDGSSYLVMDEKYPYDTGDINNPSEEIASMSYICGTLDDHVIIIFNRLVDIEQVSKIIVNNTEYTLAN